VEKLQVVQNNGLRIVTGSHKKVFIDHLHTETQMLKVGQHIDLLSSQFLANALRQDHPSHAVVTLPPGPRTKKETSYSKNIELVCPHLTDNVMLQMNYKKAVSRLHTSAVAQALCASTPNKVLSRFPPRINPEKETLSRAHRCTLTQLRSGECHYLREYLHSIGKSDDDLCPACEAASHTTRHLFECSACPTDLVVTCGYTPVKLPSSSPIFLPSFFTCLLLLLFSLFAFLQNLLLLELYQMD
jgi:hypothetical protein